MLKEILINMGWFDKISKKKKVVVLGLDGTPYSLIDGLIRQGELPNFSSLLSSGSMVKMK